MKATLVIVILTSLNITIKCEPKEAKILIKPSYPKKVRSMRTDIKIINARKFENFRGNAKLENKKSKHDSYTVFPPISDKKLLEDPESTFFPGDMIDRKVRVKKVLPEYSAVFRRKRSVKTETVINIKNGTDSNKQVHRKAKQTDSKKKLKHVRKIKGLNDNDTVRTRENKKANSIKDKNVQTVRKSTVLLKNNPKVNKTSKLRTKDKVQKQSKSKKGKRHQERKEISRRLIAGRDAMIEDYPYVVSIQKGNEHWCAGALLNPRLVITTANCIWKARSISRMRIRAGSRYMERGGQAARIQEVVKHPAWSIRSHPDNDVGLLLLDRNIKFSDSVHGVDLPNRAMWPAFEDVWVTSWGSDRRDGVYQTVGVTLQVYHAKLIDYDKCNNITHRFGVAVTRNFICIAQTGRRAPCTRDTGAPAVSDGILWGLASWGIRKLCGTERFPAMFSYLASRSNLDFITNATHYLMSDKRFYPYPDRFVVEREETVASPTTTQLF